MPPQSQAPGLQNEPQGLASVACRSATVGRAATTAGTWAASHTAAHGTRGRSTAPPPRPSHSTPGAPATIDVVPYTTGPDQAAAQMHMELNPLTVLRILWNMQ